MFAHFRRTDSWLGLGVATLALALFVLLALIVSPAWADTPPITLTADPPALPAGGGQVKLHIRLHNVKDARLDGQSLHGDKTDKTFDLTQTTTFTVTGKDKKHNNQPVTQSLTVVVAAAPTPEPTPVRVFNPLVGEFAFQTSNGHFLTALGGGGHGSNAVHTDATKIGGWEKFRLVPVGPAPTSGRPNYYAIMTSNGHYVTAVNGGGVIGDALHTDATNVAAWEIFRMFQQPGGYFTIQTVNGYLLTAVGGGGKTTDPIHTDGKSASGWEMWRLVKIGDLDNSVSYAIWSDFVSRYLTTTGAGGPHNDAVEPNAAQADSAAEFELMRQPDGTYAIYRVPYYLTALGGGGKGSAPFHLDAPQVGGWEKFSFSDQGDGTYIITTSGGGVLGINDQGKIATNGGVNHSSQLFRLIWESGF